MKIVLRSLSWVLSQVNRQSIILLIGSLALILSARSGWYALPTDTLQSFGVSLTLANYYRIVPALFGLLGIGLTIWRVNIQALRILFWSGLLVVLLFPYFQITWSPSTTFLANNLFSQNARVDRHVERNFSEIQAQWKQNILLGQPNTPEASLNALIKDSAFLQIPYLERFLTNILGYSISFFSYISLNWVIAILGFSIFLFGLYLDKSEISIKLLTKDVEKLTPWVLAGLIFISISTLLPNIIHYRLNISYAKGDYSLVENMSKTLATLYPPVQGDSYFWERRAKASYYSAQSEPYLVDLAKGLESYRQENWINAEKYFQESLDLKPNIFLARGYLASAILNQGIRDFNDFSNRNAATASASFEKVLTIFPSHTEALYDLMLARAVSGEFDKSADTALKIIETQKYAQRPRSALLGQAYLHLAWKGFKNNDYQNAWQRYRQSVDDSKWNLIIEEEQ
jgi:tetratricopeptide (TPR) repeat protein